MSLLTFSQNKTKCRKLTLGGYLMTIFPSHFKQKFPFVYIKIRIVITAKFCTWHNSYAVVAYAKFCSDLMMSNLMSDITLPWNSNCDQNIVSEMGRCYAACYWIFVSRPVVTHRISIWFTKTQTCISHNSDSWLWINEYANATVMCYSTKFWWLIFTYSPKIKNLTCPREIIYIYQTVAPFTLTLIAAWITNHIHYKLWNEVTSPFPNFNSEVIEVLE